MLTPELVLKIAADHDVDIINGVIKISGDVDELLYNKLVSDIQLFELFNKEKLNDITILLSTYGGDVYYGFAIYDFLKLTTGNLKIICSGPVMSAGVMILQAATDRVMMPNSHLLVHFGMEVNDTQSTKHHNDELTKEIKNLLVERCKAKPQTVKKWFSKESYFSYKRAIDVGLVDRVVSYE